MDFETTVAIEAPPEKVWAVLQDVERWPEWTKSMRRVERLDGGDFGMGSKVRIKQPGFLPVVWEVTRFAPGTSFGWSTKSPGAYVVADHHVTPTASGSTVKLTVSMSGPVGVLTGRLTRRRSQRYIEMEAEGLKREVEGGG